MEGGRLPYSGARGWGRDGGSGLGLMPCGRGPEAQASWGSNSPLRHAERASISCSPSSTTGGQQRLGLVRSLRGMGPGSLEAA